MHADRTNRAVLIVVALLLIAGGLLAALNSFGVFGYEAAHAPLFANPIGHFFGDHGAWMWPLIAIVSAVLVVLACRWLTVLLFSTDRANDIRIAGDRGAGRTTLVADALTEAVAEEVQSYPGVHSAKARLIGDATDPELVIETTIEQSADLSALRRRIEMNAVGHARQAMDNPSLPVTLDLTISDRHKRKVA